MKRFVLIFLGLFALCATAQKTATSEPFNLKKTIREVRGYVKDDNYQKVHETLQTAFQKWPEAKSAAELWRYEMEAQFELAKADNVKLFLKNRPDTASYFSHVLETYRAGLRCDSLDRLPDRKGRVRPEHTRQVATLLTTLRNNLRSGGRFYLKKQQYANAFSHFDTYLSTVGSPLLLTESTVYAKAKEPLDADTVDVGVMAVMAGSLAKDYRSALKYAALAERDTAHRAKLIDVRAQAHLALGDTVAHYAALSEGFRLYPTDQRFYSPLIDHYNHNSEFDRSLSMVDSLLSIQPDNDIFWTLKGKLYEAMELPDSAAEVYSHIVDLGGKYAEVYASLGMVYIEMAHRQAARQTARPNAQLRQAIAARYRQAREALEKARELSPDTPDLWRNGLREVYFKLNDGKALRKLEKTGSK